MVIIEKTHANVIRNLINDVNVTIEASFVESLNVDDVQCVV